MSDRPILFNGAMVCAILEGRKTQTRRVVNRSTTSFDGGRWPNWNKYPDDFDFSGAWVDAGMGDGPSLKLQWDDRQSEAGELPVSRVRPRIAVDDRLYVREAHYLTDDGHNEHAIFATDEDAALDHKGAIVANKHQFGLSDEWTKPHLKLRPSIHMPRWASRLTLVVTDVRIQRLQDISEADAHAEGVSDGYVRDDISGVCEGWSASTAFQALWRSINGPDAWGANPWVNAVSFDVHHCNIDQCGATQ